MAGFAGAAVVCGAAGSDFSGAPAALAAAESAVAAAASAMPVTAASEGLAGSFEAGELIGALDLAGIIGAAGAGVKAAGFAGAAGGWIGLLDFSGVLVGANVTGATVVGLAGGAVGAGWIGVLDLAGTVAGAGWMDALALAGIVGTDEAGALVAGFAGAVSILEVGGVEDAGAAGLAAAGFSAGGTICPDDFRVDSGMVGSVTAGLAVAGGTGAFASAGGEVSPFSAAKAASAEVIGARSEVPALSGGVGLAGSDERGEKGGVARRVTARRWEADAIFAPVAGGAAWRKEADFDGSGMAGSAVAGRPGIGGSGVIFEVGASPEGGTCETAAAGFCGAAAGTEMVGGFSELVAGTDEVAGFCGVVTGTEKVGGFCGTPAGTEDVGGFCAGIAGTDAVGGFVVEGATGTAGVRRNEAVGGRTLPVGGFVGKAEAGAAVASTCCGGRVSGIWTGPVRRGGAGSVVRRREPVGGRTVLVAFFGAGMGCEGPNAGGSGPVEGRAVVSGMTGAAGLGAGSGSVGWRETGLLVSKREVVGRGVVGSGAVDGLAPEIGGSGLVAGAREAAGDETGAEDTLAALGRGSVAGRAPALRGIICAEGILPPGSGGSPPVGASDDARWPCVGDSAREGVAAETDPLAGRAGESGGIDTAGGRAGGICTCEVEVFTSPVAGRDGWGGSGGSGEVGGRMAASRCICEVIAREIAAEAALGGLVDGRDRVADEGSVVRRSCAVGGRAMLTGGLGASEPGVTFAGRCGAGGGTEPEADGPSVSRM